jgi:hypothetical protein
MELRKVVIRNFGEKNIRTGAPMATLEEALVPMYFLHRYQTEAAAKVVGGLNYRYAMRGDGQPVTELIPAATQLKALDALLGTTKVDALQLPESLLSIIPPRPIGYDRHRELLKGRTDLVFDPLSAAETAADLTFGLLLHPARANRLFQQHLRVQSQPSLEMVLDRVISHTFKGPRMNGLEGGVQMNVAAAALQNLASLSVDNNATAPVKGITSLKIDQLEQWIRKNQTSIADEDWKGFHTWCLSTIAELREHPDRFKVMRALDAPPGQPIGEEDPICPIR